MPVKIIEDLESNIGRAIQTKWPDVSPKVRVKPLLDLELGDIGSNCFIDLAGLLKQDPLRVADQIMPVLANDIPYEWELIDGYLNVRLNDNALAEIETEPYGYSPEVSRVLIPGPVTKLEPWSYLRLIALGLLQWSILKSLQVPGRIIAGSDSLDLSSGELSTYLDVFRKLINTSELSSDQRLVEVESMLTEDFPGQTFLWLTPRFFPKKRFSIFFKEHIAANEKIVFRCPAQSWLTGGEYDLSPAKVLAWSDEELLALLLYLAGEVLSTEIDLTVPRLNEKDNLSWYVNSTYSRLRQILDQAQKEGTASEDQPGDERLPLEEQERRLCQRLRYAQHFYLAAGLNGEVTEFLTAFSGLLSLTNARLNTPAFRMAVENKGFFGREKEILSSANSVLSDIMNSWDCLASMFLNFRVK